ncbi:hypothetical protein B296_00008861 [Ensete ventricosum]|uniref:Uncharacterized protein n=1 Tax=Ensete ventricosum TaxID=4639 RepID=A0A427B3T6_ENSVE|nr:hypothetical protein B296_00008861 [Ensete ventricosum]
MSCPSPPRQAPRRACPSAAASRAGVARFPRPLAKPGIPTSRWSSTINSTALAERAYPTVAIDDPCGSTRGSVRCACSVPHEEIAV